MLKLSLPLFPVEKKGYPTQQGGGYPTQPTGGYPTQPVAPQQAYTTNAAPPGAMGGYAAPPPPYAPPGQVWHSFV